jgi:hypothetical protein
MTKFLLIIVLLVTGIKNIPGSSYFEYLKYEVTKPAEQGGENEQEKEDKGKSKKDSEDEIFLPYTIGLLLDKFSAWPNSSKHQDAYPGFVDGPTIPPPDGL